MQQGMDIGMLMNMLRQKQQSPTGMEMAQQRTSIDGQADPMADPAQMEKQNKMASLLRMAGGGGAPQGQMVGGQFVPPNILQQLSPLMAMFAGSKQQ